MPIDEATLTSQKPDAWCFVSSAKGYDGRVRFRFRRRGIDRYLPGPCGSPAFQAAYEAAIAETEDDTIVRETAPGRSWDTLVAAYRGSGRWRALRPATQRSYGIDLTAITRTFGPEQIDSLRPVDVEHFLAQLADRPSAANHALKMFRRLTRYAAEMGWMSSDPTRAARFRPIRSEGFHTWTTEEIARFREAFTIGSQPRLALELALYTGASRIDIVRLGPANIVDGAVRYERSKTGERVSVPLHATLREALTCLPAGRRWFLMHGSRPYTPESVGNWFSACAKAAGVSGGALHGLRKAMATQMAHAGCSEKQIAAYLGHRGTRQAEVYTRKANRELLAADAFRNFDAWVARTQTPVALRGETGRNADLS